MKETALRIRVLGDSVLRKKAKPIAEITDRHRDDLAQMARIMYESSGIGLAAPQLGINEAMLVVDIGGGLYKLINPKVTRRKGRQVLEEGCLSVPGVCVKVKRAKKITVKAKDENSRPVTIEAEDLFACVLQHEIDHLRGKLIVDYANLLQKIAIRKKIAEFKKKAKDERPS